jgi:hypothetical protein
MLGIINFIWLLLAAKAVHIPVQGWELRLGRTFDVDKEVSRAIRGLEENLERLYPATRSVPAN